MKINRTPIAFAITILWVVGGLMYAYYMSDAFINMAPSQFAEFLAGAFSPLAFLWLIIGYMQQGEELKLNTQVLAQQAHELQQSAEQHRLLVEVTREQLTEERENYAQERERMAAAAEPVFLLGQIGHPLPQGDSRPIKVANSGGIARALSLSMIAADTTESRLFILPVLETGATHDFSIPLFALQNHTFRFSYRTMHGLMGSKSFSAEMDANNVPQFIRIEG